MKTVTEINEKLSPIFEKHSMTNFGIPYGGLTEIPTSEVFQLNPPVKISRLSVGQYVKRMLISFDDINYLYDNLKEFDMLVGQIVEDFKKETGCTQWFFLKNSDGYISISESYHGYEVRITGRIKNMVIV